MSALSATAQRVQDALDAAGVTTRIVEYDVPARTSAEAAAVLGCAVGQIAKSLVFRSASGTPVLVIASGAHRVDEAKIATLAGEGIGKADADFVRTATGYVIGGIPPLGWTTTLRATRFEADSPLGAPLRAARQQTFIDRNLLAYETVYAAGGTPHAMFPITPGDLVRVTRGTVADTAP